MASLSLRQPIDIPVFAYWRQHDDLAQFAQILREHDMGFFFRSAMLVDELMTDDRIQGVTETRIGELLSSPFKINPASDKRKARKVAEAIGGTDGYSGIWETIASPTTIATLEKWAIYLGIAVASIEWERRPDAFVPRLVPWHPANLYWDDWRKVFVMNTQDSGQVTLPRPDQQPYGDGKWLVWCPYGVQYGWRSGVIRSMGEIYLSRRYAKRDFNRWTERHGIGIIEGQVPEGTTEETKLAFRSDLGNVGSDGVVITPQGDGTRPGFGVKMVDAGGQGTSWQGIKGLIDDANTDIAVLLLGGNLGTEVKEGSFAAAKDQRKTSVNRALRDATIAPEISRQVLWHWADLNYDDPSLAPLPCYEVTPPEDEKGEAEALKLLGDGAQSLALASPRVDIEAILEAAGVPMISEEELAAKMEEEAQQAADDAAAAAPAAAGDAGAADQPSPEDAPPVRAAARAALGMLESPHLRRRQFQGLDVAVEHAANTIRQWTDPTGRSGHTVMRHDYGFLDGYLGADKEELDVYLGPCDAAEHVFVVKQLGPVGVGGRWCYDEDKIFMGFPSAEAAKAAFLAHRDDGERAFGGIVMHTVAGFKAKLNRRRRDATTPIRASVSAAERALVALAMRARKPTAARTVAGRQRTAKYSEQVVKMGVRRAARALAPDLAALNAEIQAAEDWADLRRRILVKFRGMDPAKLAKVIQKAGILAHMAGRQGALEQV